jgi:hypothetical protein
MGAEEGRERGTVLSETSTRQDTSLKTGEMPGQGHQMEITPAEETDRESGREVFKAHLIEPTTTPTREISLGSPIEPSTAMDLLIDSTEHSLAHLAAPTSWQTATDWFATAIGSPSAIAAHEEAQNAALRSAQQFLAGLEHLGERIGGNQWARIRNYFQEILDGGVSLTSIEREAIVKRIKFVPLADEHGGVGGRTLSQQERWWFLLMRIMKTEYWDRYLRSEELLSDSELIWKAARDKEFIKAWKFVHAAHEE